MQDVSAVKFASKSYWHKIVYYNVNYIFHSLIHRTAMG